MLSRIEFPAVYPVGTRVRLAGGGPLLVVVDHDPVVLMVTVAWRTERGVEEVELPTRCFLPA